MRSLNFLVMKRYAVIDKRMPQTCKETLEARGFSLIPLPPFELFDKPVSAHPDMLLFWGDSLICHDEYFKTAKNEISEIAEIKGVEIELSNEPIEKKYPLDVLFNAIELGKNIICREDSVSKHIKRYAERLEKSIVNVKQGYAKCSVCKVSDNAIITADKSISKSARSLGISVLDIYPGYVCLNGYDCGFIGGASGNDRNNTYFCGNIELHPNGEEIIGFCKDHGAPAISLSDEPLYDVGTIFFI